MTPAKTTRANTCVSPPACVLLTTATRIRRASVHPDHTRLCKQLRTCAVLRCGKVNDRGSPGTPRGLSTSASAWPQAYTQPMRHTETQRALTASRNLFQAGLSPKWNRKLPHKKLLCRGGGPPPMGREGDPGARAPCGAIVSVTGPASEELALEERKRNICISAKSRNKVQLLDKHAAQKQS